MVFPAVSGACCAVTGCESEVLAKGFCSIHYGRQRRHGDPLALQPKAKARAVEREKGARLYQEKLAASASRHPRSCFFCEETFHRRAGKGRDAGKCCSRECGFGWQAFSKSVMAPISYTVRRERCVVCNSWFTAFRTQLMCSDACRLTNVRNRVNRNKVERARRRPSAVTHCVECGNSFIPPRLGTSMCSDECRSRRARRTATASGQRAANRKARKLRTRGVTVEAVNPIHVLIRDGWRCQLCGVSTPKRLRGSYEERAPEVDHILPLSQGGEHSYRNTQCACRRCNLAKSSQPLGQMRLFG